MGGSSSHTAELYDPATGTFAATGDMITARVAPSSTLIHDGRVLIAGGGDGLTINCRSLTSAELYDPTAGTFTATGNMIYRRFPVVATLLSGGKVLVDGGGHAFVDVERSQAAELYDPATGSFTLTGAKAVSTYLDYADTAELLTNGNALETFADDCGYEYQDLYDPLNDTFAAPTGDLKDGAGVFTAMPLPDGIVLMPTYRGADLYDPATGTFTPTGSMGTRRSNYTATLLPDGTVLVAGGFSAGASASAELYDPSTGNFISAGTPATLIGGSSPSLLNDDRVLLNGCPTTGNTAEIYDPVAESFSPAANWPPYVTIVGVLGVLPGGRVLLEAEEAEDYPALYDPVAGTFTRLPIWYFVDTPPAAMPLNGQILLTGGATEFGAVNWPSLFDPATGTFDATGSMSSVRDLHTESLLPDGTVLIAGGATTFNTATRSTLVTSSAEIFDPATRTFSLTGSMTLPRLSPAAVLQNNGQLLITGGQVSSPPEGPTRSFIATSSAELYTPTTLVPAPVLFSLSGDGRGQGAVWHAMTGEIASSNSPAVAGDVLSMYTTSLAGRSVIPPRVPIGGRPAEVLFFGAAPGYPGYYQVNFRVPSGVAAGPSVPVRLNYIGRSSNAVTLGVQ